MSYNLLFPQALYFDNHLRCPPGCGVRAPLPIVFNSTHQLRLCGKFSFLRKRVLSCTPARGFLNVSEQSHSRRPLGRDPETRYTGGGSAVANFSVATDETYKDKNGERQKAHRVAQNRRLGQQAEIAQQYLKKGSLIFIEGRIQSREWQDKEGQKRHQL